MLHWSCMSVTKLSNKYWHHSSIMDLFLCLLSSKVTQNQKPLSQVGITQHHSILLGLARCLMREYKNTKVKLIDIPSPMCIFIAAEWWGSWWYEINGLLAIMPILFPGNEILQITKDCWAPMAAVGWIFWNHTCRMHITLTPTLDSKLAICSCSLDEGMVFWFANPYQQGASRSSVDSSKPRGKGVIMLRLKMESRTSWVLWYLKLL